MKYKYNASIKYQKDIEETIAVYKQEAIEKQQELTIFLTTHNRESYVIPAILSLLSQTYVNFQIIVLDNGSIDGTKSAILELSSDRVKYIYRIVQLNGSPLKFAFDNCVTKYIAIVHDDDLYQPTYVEEALSLIKAQSNLNVVNVAADLIDENGKKVGTTVREDLDAVIYYNNGKYTAAKIAEKSYCSMMFPSAIYVTEYYKTHVIGLILKIPYPMPAGDQLFWFYTERLGGTMVIINKPLLLYRLHDNQDSFFWAGFMELKLYDYLLEDEYFRKICDENINKLSVVIFKKFFNIAEKYDKKIIDYKKFYSLYDYKCISYMTTCILGKIFYVSMKILGANKIFIKLFLISVYINKKAFRPILRQMKNIRNIFLHTT